MCLYICFSVRLSLDLKCLSPYTQRCLSSSSLAQREHPPHPTSSPWGSWSRQMAGKTSELLKVYLCRRLNVSFTWMSHFSRVLNLVARGLSAVQVHSEPDMQCHSEMVFVCWDCVLIRNYFDRTEVSCSPVKWTPALRHQMWLGMEGWEPSSAGRSVVSPAPVSTLASLAWLSLHAGFVLLLSFICLWSLTLHLWAHGLMWLLLRLWFYDHLDSVTSKF